MKYAKETNKQANKQILVIIMKMLYKIVMVMIINKAGCQTMVIVTKTALSLYQIMVMIMKRAFKQW